MPTNRLVSIDIARGMSVIIMVCVHTLWMYADKDTQSSSLLGDIIHFLGKGTASFLVAMGISLMLSRRQSSRDLLFRGLTILAIGYSMNFLKFVLPIMLGVMPESFVAAYEWQTPLNLSQYQYLILTGDILQMAGFSLIILSAITQFVKNEWGYLTVALAIAVSAKPLSGWTPGIDGLDYLAKVLWGNTYQIYFPLFPWLSCILVGMFIGKRFVHSQSSVALHSDCLKMGISLTLLGGGLMAWNFDYHFGNFFHTGFGGIAYLIGVNLIALWCLNKLLKSVIFERLHGLFSYCSQHVTSLYVTQWVLICWGMAIVGYQTINSLQTIMLMPLTISLTLLCHYGYVTARTNLSLNKHELKRAPQVE
ncbi:heparan-alpha-glucosaminide N-acetyltransferase domain-containing protein [Pseudoalteromonas spongiae]|uniref:heparan-alpha-glucosaminide N-acetyltransferase domain-containing protein n=1 Tax=Pseudoalteromonas spongiae TaxID=298657 RepID=UPI000C2CE97B|nr:heparan-alpha-glucosaminide N-acetyltransferase domain-containing protein [Pseudoalteromonas spongiae]